MCTRPAREQVGPVTSGCFRTAWGNGRVSVARGRLVGVELPPVWASEVDRADREAADGADRLALDSWVDQLESYFKGERLAWKAEDLALDELQVSPFDRAVYATLLSVPPAVTVSYGTLAEMAGYPRAARAVGNAMASNPIPIVVPCHRVIRADGSLGRYGSDSSWKARLLEHEQKHLSPGGG